MGVQEKQNSNSDNSELENLMQLARTGDPQAIGQLLAKYRRYLLTIANNDLEGGMRAKVGASDVVQQSMLLAQQNFENFKGTTEAELLGWLKAILVNDIRNNHRFYSTQKRDSGRELNLQERSAVRHNLVDPKLTPSSEAMKKEKAEALSDALVKLPEDYRTVIQLRNFEHLEFQEIGERMNRSADAARKLWARAIESLQTNLSDSIPHHISGEFQPKNQ